MAVPVIPATAQLSKKEIFHLLRPDIRSGRSRVLAAFFTPERLFRCGIQPERYKHVRVFSCEETAAIKREILALYNYNYNS